MVSFLTIGLTKRIYSHLPPLYHCSLDPCIDKEVDVEVAYNYANDDQFDLDQSTDEGLLGTMVRILMGSLLSLPNPLIDLYF